MLLPKSVRNLIEEFSGLPGIGPKTASRLVFYLLSKPDSEIIKFGQAAIDLKKNLKYCEKCFSIAESEICEICANPQRDKSKLMIVEEPLDVVAMEKTGFSGFYHVLGGVISPIDGIGPENLRIAEIFAKIEKDSDIDEIILATDPSLEGEATAMYIASQINKKNIKKADGKTRSLKITRIARGLPVGGDLEYADEMTLKRALEGRIDY